MTEEQKRDLYFSVKEDLRRKYFNCVGLSCHKIFRYVIKENITNEAELDRILKIVGRVNFKIVETTQFTKGHDTDREHLDLLSEYIDEYVF